VGIGHSAEKKNSMSKLTDYSKFDNLDSDDDGEMASSSGDAALVETAAPQELQVHTRKDPITGRYVYECNGQKVYEWDQSLEGTTLFLHIRSAPYFLCRFSL
jgi:hypothetical protein